MSSYADILTLCEQIDPVSLGRIGVLCGGDSAERTISLQSGEAVCKALRDGGADAFQVDTGADPLAVLTSTKMDLAFICLHGPGGEDGRMQSLLEALNIPYTGSGVAASSLAMDKYRSKLVWQALGLNTPDFAVLDTNMDWAQVMDRLGGKVMVKPSAEGSSLGMCIAESADELESAFAVARKYDQTVLAEQWIEGREFTVAIIGRRAYPIIELGTEQAFYDYQAKYHSEHTQYVCPAPLDSDISEALTQLSLDAFQSLGCSGWGRVDLMMNEQGRANLLEVNTAPGMTDHSLVPMAARQAGLDFTGLVLLLAHLASNRLADVSAEKSS